MVSAPRRQALRIFDGMNPPSDFRALRERTLKLLDGGQPAAAMQFAEQLPYDNPEAIQVRAFCEIEGGEQLNDPDLVRCGTERLADLEELAGLSMAYNRANGHDALWRIAVANGGMSRALAEHRDDLHAARDLYAHAGADIEQPDDLRCQVWVNLGNSFDNSGRHADALAAYDQALAVRPDFAMALGNRGATMLHRAAVEDVHRHALVSEAVAALDAALARRDDVLAHGGPGALAAFQVQRDRIPYTPTHEHDPQLLDDPHLDWCRHNGLFLHPSPPCITRETERLDRLPVDRIIVKVDEQARQQHRVLQDSLNSLLQDYLAVRYLAWTVLEPDTPLRPHAATLSPHATFSDSLTYARWGIATGLRVNAVAAAINLLDKIAGVAHQYLRTGQRPSHAYFRRWGCRPKRRSGVSM